MADQAPQAGGRPGRWARAAAGAADPRPAGSAAAEAGPDRRLMVVALGGNALLRRGQALTESNQRQNIRAAARALLPLAEHDLVITHGNGPQVGLLALEAACYTGVEPYALDVLGSESEGMIGYLVEQELGNVLPEERRIATLLTQVEVDRQDPAFAHPTKPIGPQYTQEEAERLAAERGWTVGPDGDMWRRLVASPLPRRIFELEVIRLLVRNHVVVICAGGGGIPTAFRADGTLMGMEAVVDKDFAGALLARGLQAHRYLMLTDVDAVYSGWGTSRARAIKRASPEHMERYRFPAGSMGPKVQAACEFVRATGAEAAIGSLTDARGVAEGKKGTTVSMEAREIEWH